MRNSLIKVNLPTGGNVSFEYELNNISTGYTVSSDSVFVKDTLFSQLSFDGYVEGDTFNSSYPKIYPPAGLPGYRVFHRLVVTPTVWPSSFELSDFFRFKKWKRLQQGNDSISNSPAFVFSSFKFLYQHFADTIPYTSEWQAIKVDTFTYRITPTDFSGISGPSFSVLWQFYRAKFTGIATDTTYTNKNYGGLRVKKIIRSDAMGQNNDLVQEYKYCQSNSESSGFIVNEPKYDFTYSETYNPTSTDPDKPVHPNPDLVPAYSIVSHYVDNLAVQNTHYNFLVRTSAAQNSLKYIHGSPAAYERVEEYQGGIDNYKSKTVYSFTNNNTVSVPAALKTNLFPFPLWPDVDFGAGLPYRVESYNAAGLLEKKSETEYTVYSQSLDLPEFKSIKVGIKEHPAINSGDFVWKYYYPVTAKIFPVRSVETEYFADGSSVVNETATQYDTAYMVPKLVKTLNARNQQVVTRYYYPYEFNITGAITTLKNKGMVYDPVRTEIWRDSTKVLNAAVSTFFETGGMVKQDASYGLTVTDPVPSGTWGAFDNTVLLPNATSFTKLVNLDRYDAKGNLTQTTTNGVISCTVWDYKSAFPIAQVNNSLATRVAYTSFEADGKGGWTFDAANTLAYSIPFTGKKVFNLSTINTISKTLVSSTVYILSARTRTFPPVINIVDTNGATVSITPVLLDSHNGWRHYQAEISIATQITISAASTTKLDELRLYPKGASMVTYTYDPLFGVTSVSDVTGRTVYNEYDKFGRVKYQRDMDGNILKVNEYKNQDPQN